MDATHDQIAQIKGIPARLYLFHHENEKFISYFQLLQVIAFHALEDSRHLYHTHPQHKYLLLLYVL